MSKSRANKGGSVAMQSSITYGDFPSFQTLAQHDIWVVLLQNIFYSEDIRWKLAQELFVQYFWGLMKLDLLAFSLVHQGHCLTITTNCEGVLADKIFNSEALYWDKPCTRSTLLLFCRPSLPETGTPRNVEDIRSCVLSQLRLATFGIASRVEALQTAMGTKDKIAQHWIDILIPKAQLLIWLSTQTDQPYTPLLDLPFFDPSQDTLVEILHTILFGDAKYTWYELHHNWAAVQQNIFTIRLQSTDLDGLRVPPIRAAYIMQYRNGLIGKHFKTLMQTMIFHIHDIVTSDQFTLVRALGELGPVLWMPIIDDMDQYLLHVLLHIIQDIRRRGPAVRFSIEVFECFNAIFRLCSVLSNHQAPSRDITAKLADLDCVKHILRGGFWFQDGAWISAGKDVHRILRTTPIIQRHIGWAPPPVWTPGIIRALAQKKQTKRPGITLQETLLVGASNPCSINVDYQTSWTNAVDITAQSGDRCKVGSWAVFRVNELAFVGRVRIILLPKGSKSAKGLLVVSRYDVGEALHSHLHMPVLLPDADEGRVVLPSNSLQFSFNAQHDCRACGYEASGVKRQMQERQESNTLVHSVVHEDDDRFVINTHGFHDAGLLRKYLPIALTTPSALYTDRRERHDEHWKGLGAPQKEKRAATGPKTAATRQKKKAEAERSGVGRGPADESSLEGQPGGLKRTQDESLKKQPTLSYGWIPKIQPTIVCLSVYSRLEYNLPLVVSIG
ncbi:hypothetical protein B0H14DRAFT_2593909 [Mycena olivaceomarginata]|nr:hypothetical protein B0H14DRAFT_2593909 [Mycena olivaceomarginata]